MGKSLAAAKPALKDIKKDASKFIKSSKTKRLQAQLSKVHAYGKSPRMTKDEKRIILQMASERNMPPIKIAEAVGRHVSNISRLLKKKKETKMGRPLILTKEQVDRLEALLEAMVDKAAGNKEVALGMLMRRSRTKASVRTVADRLRKRGYQFRDLREKPTLTPDDIKLRYKFAKTYKDKPDVWWLSYIHVHLDNHMFKVATTAKGRKLLAKRRVRGVYRKKGKSLRPAHVKPKKDMKLSTGARGILKTGGVGHGKILVWHTVPGRWGGDAAAHMYKNVLAKALKKEHPGKKKFRALEDNDPTGNLSKKGIAAKVDCKIEVFEIPKRSPDLNVLDYAIWSKVETLMRAQEGGWPDSKRETREQFEKRLDRTALTLDPAFINKCILSLKERCKRLYDAKGGLFEEGGRKSRRPL